MSLVNIAKAIADETDYNTRKALAWVMNHIDMEKLVERVAQATSNSFMETKCILMEYNYTSWSDIDSGHTDLSDRLPGTDVLVHSVVSNWLFLNKLSRSVIGLNDPRAHLYIRRKVCSDGTLDKSRRQIVLRFDKEEPHTPVSEAYTDSCF